MSDESIDYSDIPPLTDEFFENATLTIPAKQAQQWVKLDPDVLEWFQAHSDEYKAAINSVLRQFTKRLSKPDLHHVSIRTADIFRAIAFYEQLGFTICERFQTGYTLACWMEGLGGRIELLQIPEPKPALDAFNDEHYTGYYHLSFDVTELTEELPQWIELLKTKLEAQDQVLTVLLEPTQQMIGDRVYEVAFIADMDGLPIEFLNRLK